MITAVRAGAVTMGATIVALVACGPDSTVPTTLPPGPDTTDAPVADIVHVFRGATVVTMDDAHSVLFDHSVLVRNDEIERVAPTSELDVPDSAIVIDSDGLVLAPGLTDMHVHVTVGSAAASRDQGLLFVANGVTTILNMGDVGINGDIHQLQRAYRDGPLPGPTMLTAKFGRGPEDGGASFGLVVNTPSAAPAFVRGAKAAGYDFIKSYNFIRADVHAALVSAATNENMAVIGHVPVFMRTRDVVEGGQKMIAHSSEYWWQHYDTLPDPSRTPSAIEYTVAHGTWLTPTLSATEGVTMTFGNNQGGLSELLDRPGTRYTHPAILGHWQGWLNNGQTPGARDSWLSDISDFTGDFHVGGVRLLLGTDSPDVAGLASGFGVYEEIRLLEGAGIAPQDVVRIATRNAGDFVSEHVDGAQPFGRIVAGHRADLLLLRGNPLDDTGALQDRVGVMVRGRWLPQDVLDASLDSLATSYGN